MMRSKEKIIRYNCSKTLSNWSTKKKMTKRFFPLCSRQLIKWRCLTALYSLPLWPFLSGTPGVHCSDDNVAMSTSCRYINQAFESRKLEYLIRIKRPLLMRACEHTLAIRIIVHRLIRNKLIWSANSVILFSFNLQTTIRNHRALGI